MKGLLGDVLKNNIGYSGWKKELQIQAEFRPGVASRQPTGHIWSSNVVWLTLCLKLWGLNQEILQRTWITSGKLITLWPTFLQGNTKEELR